MRTDGVERLDSSRHAPPPRRRIALPRRAARSSVGTAHESASASERWARSEHGTHGSRNTEALLDSHEVLDEKRKEHMYHSPRLENNQRLERG